MIFPIYAFFHVCVFCPPKLGGGGQLLSIFLSATLNEVDLAIDYVSHCLYAMLAVRGKKLLAIFRKSLIKLKYLTLLHKIKLYFSNIKISKMLDHSYAVLLKLAIYF